MSDASGSSPPNKRSVPQSKSFPHSKRPRDASGSQHASGPPRASVSQPFSQSPDPHPYFPWMAHIPAHLRRRLIWNPSTFFEVPKANGILCLYAGKDDPGSQDAALHQCDPSCSEFVVAIDTVRSKSHDMLAVEPYSSLCTGSVKGSFCILSGGPMCATTSVRRNIPIPGNPRAPRVVRGRDEVTFWGLPQNTPDEQKQCDDHATLWIRQMYLTCLIYSHGTGECGSYLEHPGDPANYYTHIPGHDTNPTIWIMRFFRQWVDDLNALISQKHISRPLKVIRFSQCHYGQVADKYTMEATDLPMIVNWDGNICNHT